MAGESARAAARSQRDKAERLLRSADAFERGAAGEVSTAEVIGSLPSNEWRVFHDVRWPRRQYANIDHVVVGPTGVFVIDTKAWSGDIEVRGGGLRQDGKRRSRTVVAAAAAAMAVDELVPGLDTKAVNPVLCFVRDEPVFGWAGDVMVCSTHNLATFMTSRPRVLVESEVVEVAGALSMSLEAACAPVRSLAPTSLAPPTVTSSGSSRARTRVPREPMSAGARMALRLSLIAAIAGLALGFDVPSKVGHVASQAVQRVIAPTQAIGTPVPVPGFGARPSLEVTAGTPLVTRATTKSVRPARGHQLVAVPVTIRNTGDSAWTSRGDLRALVTDRTETTYSSDPAYTHITAGRPIPAAMTLHSGRARHGFVVFDVPRGTQVAKVQLTVGPGLPKKMSWSVGR